MKVECHKTVPVEIFDKIFEWMQFEKRCECARFILTMERRFNIDIEEVFKSSSEPYVKAEVSHAYVEFIEIDRIR